MRIRYSIGATTAAVLAVLLGTPGLAAASSPSAELALAGFNGLANAGHGGRDVTVAIVDSGVDLTHAELSDQLVPGIDLVDGDSRPEDENGHGTHVAGIVLSGAPQANIMPVRVLDAAGAAPLSRVAEGVRWAADHGADVINVSIGDTGRLDRLRKSGELGLAVREVANRAVVVAAAGNDGQYERVFRVGVPVLVAVAVDDAGTPAPFSNHGSTTAVAAPGVDVDSTTPTRPTTLFPSGTSGHASLSGTSMAAPFVAAEAALLVQAGASPADAIGAVERSVHNEANDPRLGHGLIDAGAAVESVGSSSESTAPPPEDPGPPTASNPPTTDERSGLLRKPAVVGVIAIALGAVLGGVIQRRRQTSGKE